MVSLAMFVVPIKILHIKWTKMKEERLLEDRLRKAVSENEKVLFEILIFCLPAFDRYHFVLFILFLNYRTTSLRNSGIKTI